MTDFNALPHDVRKYALVGKYFHIWAGMEATLNIAIENGLNLTTWNGVILARNTQFADKVRILRTLVNRAGLDPIHDKPLTTLQNKLVDDRNCLAHTPFVADDQGDGIHLLVAEARGKLAFPDTRWSVADFENKYAQLHEIRKQLEVIATLLRSPDETV